MRGCLGERALDHSRQPSSPQWVAYIEWDGPNAVAPEKRSPKHRKRSTMEPSGSAESRCSKDCPVSSPVGEEPIRLEGSSRVPICVPSSIGNLRELGTCAIIVAAE